MQPGGKVDKRIEEFREYLINKERSVNTIDNYIRSVAMFYDRYDEVNKKNMMDFKQYLVDSKKPKTAAVRCIAMNVYCDFLEKPECRVKSIKVHNQTTLENVITMNEYRYFQERLKRDGAYKVYYMIKFLAATGCRASELVKLEKSCLNTGEFSMWTKGKIRKILIPQSLIDESRAYFDSVDSEYLFPNRFGEQMSTRGAANQIKKYGLRYGIREEVLHPHAFRHLFAIQFLEKNKNIALLADIMGHESMNTTAIYLRMSAEEQKKQLNSTVNW